MTAVTERAVGIVKELRDAGIRCTLDTPVATPPCAVLRMPSMLPAGNVVPCSNTAVMWEVHLVAKGSSDWIAWQRLDEMRETVWEMYGPTIRSCDPGLFDLDAETQAPSYEISFEELV